MIINPKLFTSATDWKNYDTTKSRSAQIEHKLFVLACMAGVVTIVMFKLLEVLCM